MVLKTPQAATPLATNRLHGHVLVIEARFYERITDLLVQGAIAEITSRGLTFERLAVPGALEIPQVLAAAGAARASKAKFFDGAVALGCVIRGETAHYDIVCNNANHWLMDAAMRYGIPLGNGILTVENEAQALARTEGGRANKGGDAARACVKMIELQRVFAGAAS